MNRREFLSATVATLGTSAFASGWRLFGSNPLLKLGVLSDIHLCDPGDETTFIKALEYFRDHGAEAVLIAGDFADTGRIYQAKMLADAWFKVFPNDLAPDGRKVERLFIFGNHCITSWAWGDEFKKNPARARAETIGFEDNRRKVWDEFFHEEFQPIWMKTVKGIPVIGAHWDDTPAGNGVEAFMRQHGKAIDPKLPFIYTQHDHPKDTCFGAWAWGHDDGRATRALSPFPNAIAFSGHSHYTLTDERSVWQGAFTSINTSSLKYSSVDYSLRENIDINGCGFQQENRPHRMPQVGTFDGRQGQLVAVYGDHLEIERREFVYGQSLGPNWVVPLPAATATYSYAERAKKRLAPEFAPTAKLAIARLPVKDPADRRDFEKIELTFPAAVKRGENRVFEYEVTAILCEDDLELVQAQRRMMSPDYYLPEAKLASQVKFVFAADDLKAKGNYRFEVRPVECFGRKGLPISAVFKV